MIAIERMIAELNADADRMEEVNRVLADAKWSTRPDPVEMERIAIWRDIATFLSRTAEKRDAVKAVLEETN